MANKPKIFDARHEYYKEKIKETSKLSHEERLTIMTDKINSLLYTYRSGTLTENHYQEIRQELKEINFLYGI